MMTSNKSSNSKPSPFSTCMKKANWIQSCINYEIKRKCKQALFHLAPQSSLGSGEKRPLVQFYIITCNYFRILMFQDTLT